MNEEYTITTQNLYDLLTSQNFYDFFNGDLEGHIHMDDDCKSREEIFEIINQKIKIANS
jgi:hypothetical protein